MGEKICISDLTLDALTACRRNGAWIDGALKQVLKRDGLSGRDAAFASRIAYGVMQSRIYLDRCLARCLTQRPEKLEPLLLDILRVGAYQILLMDKVPVNAAVNEAVEMAKAHKLSRAAGLVNAVLRNVDRRRGEPLAFADEREALSVQTSHPRALVERVVGLLGAEEAEAFLRQQFTRLQRLGNALFRQVYIRPTCETVFFVPSTLSMTK